MPFHSRKHVAYAFIALGTVAGCGSLDTRIVPLGMRLPPLTSSAPVHVYRAPLPPMEARELGLIEITSYDSEMTPAEMMDRLRDAARTLGGNAVVWTRVDRTTGFLRVVGSALRLANTPASAP